MNTLTDTYYLKALDEYNYDFPSFLEAINYALAYDENNADAHYLKGRFYMEHLHSYEEAKQHFELALANDINHIQTHYYFIRWGIDTGNFELSEKLIAHAMTVTGICEATLLHREGTIREKQGRFKKAKKLYESAIEISIFDSDGNFFKQELVRVKDKINRKKKQK